MERIIISTTKKVVPKIYAYTTPEVKRHDGWIKIGYTEQEDVNTRIAQQTHTADILTKLEWQGNAIFEGTMERFKDTDFHSYLRKLNYENTKGTEWFHIDSITSKNRFYEFRENKGILDQIEDIIPYKLRPEQKQAVEITYDYFKVHDGGEFLWNAKPRFGKTLATYDLCKRLNAKNILIVTNRPAIANSWYSDYVKFIGDKSGYKFISETDSLKKEKYVLSRDLYEEFRTLNSHIELSCIEFLSLQDLKGSIYFGGSIDKLKHIYRTKWDILIIDEAHEGVDTFKTDVAFDRITRKYTLHLSGTPFKALANDKFDKDAIYNWTYADEQEAKNNWDKNSIDENPYINLPKLNMFTYQMSEIVENKIRDGIEIDDKIEEYAFDLNEFFATRNGRFIHDESVNKFLDALTTQEKFPFSTPELRTELKHTFWLLNRVDSAKALASKLKNHPIFKEYEIVLAAGDGQFEDSVSEIGKSFNKVRKAIESNDKTITLSVGQLTTGVTIPEWTAVLMLSNVKSPALYMQAAFRSQNPMLFEENGVFRRKQNSYIFDFDPARTLIIFEQFANDLSSNTSQGRGDSQTRKNNIKTLLNFFPVYGEDENGEMIELDASKVLSIPRKIKSKEVVKQGFMSNFLFQNITNVFNAPDVVMNIINNFEAVNETKANNKINMIPDADELSINDDGDVELTEEYVIGKSNELFGDKIYDVQPIVENVIYDVVETKEDQMVNKLHKDLQSTIIKPIIETISEGYDAEIKKSDKNKMEKDLNSSSLELVKKEVNNFNIQKNIAENNYKKELETATNNNERKEITESYELKIEEMAKDFSESLTTSISNFVEDSKKEVINTIEVSKKEQLKNEKENEVRNHLRGFSRTIPSFLMAYGDDSVLLETFDKIIPENVFLEVTSITLDEFRFLRDGGNYIDKETGEEKYFEGKLFDPVVFNDSITEFLKLKDKLSNYFDENQEEDIFDYVPPQKTNQIYTPKRIVKQMVDYLEQENPNCFNDPDKTFADLYMKSGLYITEIVKRLFNSDKLKELYPDEKSRLQHIFRKQVFGLAPTEIIYKISINYILGFDKNMSISNHNFKQVDAMDYMNDGQLEVKLDELFN